MNIKENLKKNYILLCSMIIVAIVVFMFLVKKIGIKDSGMASIATVMLLLALYCAFYDMKKSIFLFILCLPIFVTARKIVYFDILFIKVSYESIYITIMFILNIKKIGKFVKEKLYNKESLSSKFLIMILIFVLLAINSNIFSEHIMTSLSSTFISVLVPVMFMLTTLVNFKNVDIKNIYYALILSLDLTCFYGFTQVFMNHLSLGEIRIHRNLITFGYHNVNIFAGILLLVVPLVLELILYRKLNKKEKTFVYGSLLIYMVSLTITFSRGAWISFLIVTFIMLISQKYKKIVYFLGIAFLLSSRWLVVFILHRGEINAAFFKNESMMARLQAIVASIKIVIKYPFGAGGATFADLYKKFAMDAYLTFPQSFRIKAPIANYAMENAHNLWLQIAVEFGFVCSILFFIIIINRIKVIFQNYDENRGVFTSIIIYMIYSVLTGIEFDHKGVITGTLIIWLIFTIVELKNKEGSLIEKINVDDI
ncbi:O-antigen ligase [Clostridium sp.]|uniref:O-antigen ligase family protein n=1 Tax=Clostridium sp. TaxID=1506 RepID=UPI001A5F3790|nr:O-antigen ligase family protein [Clostridium sp.]MBK5234110.1 O-antigen ligase family protein [Clostridium sp.]